MAPNSQGFTTPQQMSAYAGQLADQARGERIAADSVAGAKQAPQGTVYDQKSGTFKDPNTGNTYIGSQTPNGLQANPTPTGGLRFQDNPVSPVVVSTSDQARADLLGKQNHVNDLSTSIANQSNAKAAATANAAALAASTPPPVPTTEDIVGGLTKRYDETAQAGTGGSALDSLASATSNSNDLIQKAYNDYKSQMDSLKNGTIPLTPEQQGMVDSATASAQRMEALQAEVNQRYEAGIQRVGVMQGTNISSPKDFAQSLLKAQTEGVAKIANIEAQSLDAIAKLKQGFSDQNYKVINDQYEKLTTLLDKKQTAISNLAKAAQDHEDKMMQFNLDQQKFAETQRQNDVQNSFDATKNKLASDQFGFSQKKEAFDEAMRSNDFSEKQKQDAQDNYYKGLDAAYKQGQLTLDKQKEAFAENPGADANFAPGATATAVDKQKLPGVLSTGNGLMYFDQSQFSDKKDAAKYEALARQYGVPVLSAKDAETVSSVDTAMANIDKLQKSFNELASSGLVGKGFSKITNPLSKLFDTDYGSKLAAYQQNRDILFQQISTLAGSHPRLNAQELTAAANALPKLDEFNADTIKDGANKIDMTKNYLQGSLKSVLNNNLQYTDISSYTKNNPDTAQATIQKVMDNAKANGIDIPSGPDGDAIILQAIQAGQRGFTKPLSMGENGSAEKLAMAIKQVESGGNYSAKGASTEGGAYQFMPASWKSWAGQYLGNPNAEQTPENQDKVATSRIQDLLDQGHSPKEVALIWNGGQPIEKSGVNKFGVKYDSGAYARRVLSALNKIG